MNKQRTIVGLDQLAEQIEQWATDRGIDKAEPRAQFLKVVEEVGEIAAAMARNNHDELVDAIGDVFVTLVVLSMQHGIGIEDAIQAAYNEIKNRKGKTVNGVFLRDISINDQAPK
jgi:NTP pyrophosphatase (non-canonical NTP hydrolase)